MLAPLAEIEAEPRFVEGELDGTGVVKVLGLLVEQPTQAVLVEAPVKMEVTPVDTERELDGLVGNVAVPVSETRESVTESIEYARAQLPRLTAFGQQ